MANPRIWVERRNYAPAGKVILTHIQRAGLTRNGFAKVASIAESTMYGVCTGDYNRQSYLSFDLLDRIAACLYPRDRAMQQAFNAEVLTACGLINVQDANLVCVVLRCANELNVVGRIAFGRARSQRRKRIAAPPAPSAEQEQVA